MTGDVKIELPVMWPTAGANFTNHVLWVRQELLRTREYSDRKEPELGNQRGLRRAAHCHQSS